MCIQRSLFSFYMSIHLGLGGVQGWAFLGTIGAGFLMWYMLYIIGLYSHYYSLPGWSR
jgi:hypothetical protein